jgi:glycosyltransferase involved in cell wall biosynthesis
MILLHVTPYFAPAWSFGGVCRAVSDLARAQVASGHRVSVLTTDALTRSSRVPASEETIDGVRVVRVRTRSLAVRARLNLSTPIGFRHTLRRLLTADPPDVIHCHELRTIETLHVAEATRAAGRPLLVVSPHGTLPYHTGRTWGKRAWDTLLSRRLLPRLDQVIALTPAEAWDAKALWARHGVPLDEAQIAIVPNGVDAELAVRMPPRAAARSRWRLGEGPVVLFLGRLAERKGLPLLASAFASVARRLASARLLIAGPDEGARAELMAEIARRELDTSVVLAGMLTEEERLMALAASDVFALPAVGEGFSMAVLEAMACSVPVVVSRECHFPEVAEAGAGLTVERTVSAWSDALSQLLADPASRADMGRRGRDLVRANYGWPRIAHRMESAYQAGLERLARR